MWAASSHVNHFCFLDEMTRNGPKVAQALPHIEAHFLLRKEAASETTVLPADQSWHEPDP